jgi:hypothetical protein
MGGPMPGYLDPVRVDRLSTAGILRMLHRNIVGTLMGFRLVELAMC